MRRLILFVAIGICLALFGGRVSADDINCAPSANAHKAAAEALGQAVQEYQDAMASYTKAMESLSAAQRAFINASILEAWAVGQDVQADNNYATCMTATLPPSCDVENQARLQAEKGLSDAWLAMAQARDRMDAAKRTADDAGVAAKWATENKEAARKAYEAAMDSETKCWRQRFADAHLKA